MPQNPYAENCFDYTEVPPNELDCNPYESKLKLQCTVMGPLNSSYDLVWFYEGKNTLESTVACASYPNGTLTSVLEVNPNPGDSIMGDYYCQIRLGNGSWLDPSPSHSQDLSEALLMNLGLGDCPFDPSVVPDNNSCVGFAENVANNSIGTCSFTPEPTPSSPSATTTRNTPSSDDIHVTATHSMASTPTPQTRKLLGIQTVWRSGCMS